MMTLSLLCAAAGVLIADQPIEVKVLVVNYNPIIESEGGKRLNEVLGWNDPKKLSEGYVSDVKETSKGFVQYRIVEWRDVDQWPQKVDGYTDTDETFLAGWKDRTKFHKPDGASYEWTLESQKVVPLVESGKIDELWIFGAPYMGYWEAAMAGPGAFFINGGVYDKIPSKKRFAIMGFSYERGVAEMIHNLCHRAENHFKRVYGGWNAGEHKSLWDRFSAHEKTSPGKAGVGNCHFPPNAEKDYDYKNPRKVMSSADEWLNYPKLDGKQKEVSCETWGGPDYHRNYLKWWYTRLPNLPGKAADGRQHNWWKYIFAFNDYDERGMELPKGKRP